MVMLKACESIIAPPACTFALLRPCMNVALLAVGLIVPPLKLKFPVPVVCVTLA